MAASATPAASQNSAGEGVAVGPVGVSNQEIPRRCEVDSVREHRTYPRLRLDLRNALTWREDVEAAVERLLASVRTPALSPPRRA